MLRGVLGCFEGWNLVCLKAGKDGVESVFLIFRTSCSVRYLGMVCGYQPPMYSTVRFR